MRLQDIMNTDVVTIQKNEPAQLAKTIMWQRDIHHLVVLDGNRLAGVLSARDLNNVDEYMLQNRQVDMFMSTDLTVADPEDTVQDAANRLRGNVVGCLPVLDQSGKLAGIVTTTDILELVGRGKVPPRYAARSNT